MFVSADDCLQYIDSKGIGFVCATNVAVLFEVCTLVSQGTFIGSAGTERGTRTKGTVTTVVAICGIITCPAFLPW